METKKKTFMDRFLNFVETVGNEMYPLYWTPSKEGTFCVIRLNLS
ncbi:hypothetical protein I3500192B8_17060 [Acidaminococcus intestini]